MTASVLDVFDAACERDGGRDLVRYFDTPLRAGELRDDADALAAALARRGVERGDRVALHMQNVPHYVIALLAVWRLGAIAVACSPMLTADELERQLRDADPIALISLDSLYEQAGREVAAVLGLPIRISASALDHVDPDVPPALLAGERRRRFEEADDLVELIAAHRGATPPAVALAGDDVAVLTYTSGTTGPPKGAMNTHGNILHSARVFQGSLALGRDDVLLGIAPLFHVTGLVAHIALALLGPYPLVLCCRFDATEVARLIERHRATFVVGPSTAYVALMRAATGPQARDLSSLRICLSGGAPLPVAVVDQWEALTGRYLHNGYGLTETTSPTHIVALDARAPLDDESGVLSVGRAVAGTQVRIVDADGRTLPAGARGEIAIRGPQVVPGYWRQPRETAHAFPDGELRTGDVGVIDDDGWLYVVDRIKDLIVASGFKIWPREVEEVLYEHPSVREAAVVGVRDEYRGETVKAFVALRDGAAVQPAELIAFARERLAAYKYPREVELVQELPKNASGKILRRELRAVSGGAP